MKNEIKEILEFKENADYKKLSVDEIAILKDYITNLRTIEEQYSAILSENAELKNKIFDLEDTLIDKKEYCYGLETQLTNLQQENEKLKELCNKYEEEHSTAFNLWKTNIIENVPALSDMQEQLNDYKSRNEKASDFILSKAKEYKPHFAKVELNTADCNELLNILNGGDEE
jgi:DNA repair ATPase RecN